MDRIGFSFMEGQATNRPPYFDGTNYVHWKTRMQVYLEGVDFKLWRLIECGYSRPTITIGEGENRKTIPKPVNDYTDEECRMAQLNSLAKNHLFCAISPNEYNRVMTCESAQDVWKKLEVVHEGTNQVRETKANLLIHEYELFVMKNDETISEMYARFTHIVNNLKSLGRVYANGDLVRKILRCLPREWDAKVTAIQEAKDVSTLDLDELLGSLLTHEINMNKGSMVEPKKDRRNLALKSKYKSESSEEEENSESSESSSGSELNDRELKFFMKNFAKMMKKKSSGEGRRCRPPSRKVKGEGSRMREVVCYECNKPGHVKPECPLLKKTGRLKKKKAMVATWSDDSDEGEEGGEMATMALMAINNKSSLEDEGSDNEVTSSSSSSTCNEFSYDELFDAFQRLHVEYKKLASKHSSMKKLHASTLNDKEKELDELKEKIESLNASTSTHQNLINENAILKSRVEDLKKSLEKSMGGRENLNVMLGAQKHAHDKSGLGYHSTKKHVHKHPRKTFDRTIARQSPFIRCYGCNRKGHKVAMCPFRNDLYVRSHTYTKPKALVKNRKKWVIRGSYVEVDNPHPFGPKRIWVPLHAI